VSSGIASIRLMHFDPASSGYSDLAAIGADRFDRAAFHRFFAKRIFLGSLGLLVNKGVPAIVVALVIGRGGFAAEIAIDALVIDIELTVYVFRIFVCSVGHIFPLKAKWKVGRNPCGAMDFSLWNESAQPAGRAKAKSG
jgi:hypothetical protein